MDGNVRYELMSSSSDTNFSGNYQNGTRGYPGSVLGRSSSFREGSESRGVGSGKLNSRATAPATDGPTLSQCLMLEPIAMGDSKHARPGELRRALTVSAGSNPEESPFGAPHIKNSPPMAVEELKRLRACFADSRVKASCRVKKLDEHLNKLNKYFEAMPSKKQQQRNELLMNERSSVSTKIGPQMHRNPSELGSQKFDDRPKNVGLNKRLRTSVAETRSEGRNNGVIRQSLLVTKERDLLKDNNGDPDTVEEKIRRLPAGGEGWDKKMKRKRSVSTALSRPIDGDGELKRNTHLKHTIEPSMPSSDSTHGFRSGIPVGHNKLDPVPSPVGSMARTTIKIEQEKPMLSRDISCGPVKERAIGKLNVKLNNREDNQATLSTHIVKGKASRGARSGSIVATNSASNSPCMPGTLESWEQPQVVNKIPPSGGTTNNRKRAMPAGSSSPPITQWGGHRSKISRTRRTNLIPVSNHDEVQMQPEGYPSSDFSPRISPSGISASPFSKSETSGDQNFKVKSENVLSPAMLSESEESGVGESQTKDKSFINRHMEEAMNAGGQNVGQSHIPMKKNKVIVKENGVRRQGRGGMSSPFSKASASPPREKLDNVMPNKPFRTARSGSDRTGSKSGRPSKKLSDRRGFSRLGHVANGGSPDCSGESDDDHEELLTAASLACSSSYNACSSAFWKTFENFFASVDQDESFLSQQFKSAEELCTSLSQMSDTIELKLDDYCREETAPTESISFGNVKNGNEVKVASVRREFTEQLQNSSFSGASDADKVTDMGIPLYQRVLSALIMEDEIEESEETGFGKQKSLINDSSCPVDSECELMDRMNFCEPVFGVQTWKNVNAHKIFPCNGNVAVGRSPRSQDLIPNGELLQSDIEYPQVDVEMLVGLSSGGYIPQSLQACNGGISSLDFQHLQLCLEEKLLRELQSVGLFVETVPALDDKDDDIFCEVAQLQRKLHEKAEKKKKCLDKLYRGVQLDRSVGRDLEKVAIDKLVELAYKKVLATRGSFASKHGIPKVSKQVASAFVKRTLSRCSKFEVSGASCFSESALREIVYAAPPRFNESELLSGDGTSIHQSARSGPLPSNRGKKKEVLLDDVGGAPFRTPSGSTKGKRSERDVSIAKAGRLSTGGSKGERKTKSKPKQKMAQLPTSGNGFVSGSTETANRRKDVRFMSSGNVPSSTSKEVKESSEFANLPLDGIEDLDVDPEIGAPQDINSWFNFEVDGLQDHNFAGLDIPMDDLSELF